MLDATAIANESDYTQDDIRDLYVRRFKKDVLNDLKQWVPERNVDPVEAQASTAEEQVFEQLNELTFERIDSRRTATQLFKTTLLKAMLSSPAACLETVNNRIKRLQKQEPIGPAERQDIGVLDDLRRSLERVDKDAFSKYQALLVLLRQQFKWKGKDRKDRLVIFTGRLETLKFLKEHLPQALKLKPEAVEVLDGGMPDVEQNRIVEAFGQESAKVLAFQAIEPFAETVERTQLGQEPIPNPGEMPVDDLLPLRAEAIEQARRYLLAERTTFDAVLSEQLQEQKARLDRLQGHHMEQLELLFGADKRPEAMRQQRRQNQLTHIQKVFKDYRDWVNLSMTTEPEPFVKLVAVLQSG